jgi:hypothetical protein
LVAFGLFLRSHQRDPPPPLILILAVQHLVL